MDNSFGAHKLDTAEYGRISYVAASSVLWAMNALYGVWLVVKNDFFRSELSWDGIIAIIAIVLGVVAVLAPFIWRKLWRRYTFRIDFPGELHPPTEVKKFPRSKTVTLEAGKNETEYVRVRVNHALSVDHMNVRFVKTKRRGGDISEDIVMIQNVYDAHIQGRGGTRKITTIKDGKNGVEMQYEPTPMGR